MPTQVILKWFASLLPPISVQVFWSFFPWSSYLFNFFVGGVVLLAVEVGQGFLSNGITQYNCMLGTSLHPHRIQ